MVTVDFVGRFGHAQHDWRDSRYTYRDLLKPESPRWAEVVLHKESGVRAERAYEQVKKRGLISCHTDVCLYAARHTLMQGCA